MICVQAVTGNKKFLFQFEDDQKRDKSSVSLSYVCLKEEVCLEIDDPLFGLPQK